MLSGLPGWLLPLATGVLVTVFDVLLWRQWSQRRKRHQLWWASGFALYAAAAFMELAGYTLGGWQPLLFRVYAITTAVLVPVLAQGTVELMSRKRTWPRVYLGYNSVVAAIFAFGVVTTPLITEELAKVSLASYAPLGGTALSYPRVLSMALTIPASLVLFGGAILSIVRFLRNKEFAYRVWANVLIAVATLVIASGGGLAKSGSTELFYLTEMLAAVLYFAGFLMASDLKKGARRARTRRAETG